MTRFALALVVVGVLGFAALSGVAMGDPAAPGFAGGGPWFNTGGQPLSLAALRGKVVAVDMWTAGCINCLNTLPYVKQWYAKYRDRGFVVVGVHSPEFESEHSAGYVSEAIGRLGITYPVVMDNDHRIWNAYSNRYWPTLYLLDKRGRVRYTHIGEGDYYDTELQIIGLLREPS